MISVWITPEEHAHGDFAYLFKNTSPLCCLGYEWYIHFGIICNKDANLRSFRGGIFTEL
jgi:hypothetical protein